MSALATVKDAPPAELVEQINSEHRKATKGMRTALEHAINCGNMLLAVRRDMIHGEWASWLSENFEASQRTADQYIQLADYYEKDKHAVAAADPEQTISAALKSIARTIEGPRISYGQDDEEVVDAQVVDDESHIIQEPVYTLTAERLMILVTECSTWPQALRQLRGWGLSE